MDISISIPAKRIADIMTTAIESGYSTYWCAGVFIKGTWARKTTSTQWWYASPEVFDGSFTIEVHERDENSGKITKHLLNADDVAKGFAIWARKAGSAFGEFLADNEDGPCADTWLQCIALGEVRYG